MNEEKITGKDLVKAGLPAGPHFQTAIESANKMLEAGQSRETCLLETIKAHAPEKKLVLRKEGPPVEVACEPRNQEEQENNENSLQKMRELARVPIVEACALMPDNCPSGREWGAIPVGGAIATTQAVIPAAHSAD